MIDPSLLEVLGCPLEPERPPFRELTLPAQTGEVGADQPETYLVCTSCGSAFPVKDGIPYLLPEDAITPEKLAELMHAD